MEKPRLRKRNRFAFIAYPNEMTTSEGVTNMPIWATILIALIAAALSAAAFFYFGQQHRRKTAEAKIGSAEEEAVRIARKYIAMVIKSFGLTGHLWEKYNVTDGTTNVSNEYEMPTMLGWSAGTFIYADEFLKGNK